MAVVAGTRTRQMDDRLAMAGAATARYRTVINSHRRPGGGLVAVVAGTRA
jgi:hypothetical protein